MNIPEYSSRKLTEAERFLMGLRDLCEETKAKNWSMVSTEFGDGSKVGNGTAYKYAFGLIDMDQALGIRK